MGAEVSAWRWSRVQFNSRKAEARGSSSERCWRRLIKINVADHHERTMHGHKRYGRILLSFSCLSDSINAGKLSNMKTTGRCLAGWEGLTLDSAGQEHAYPLASVCSAHPSIHQPRSRAAGSHAGRENTRAATTIITLATAAGAHACGVHGADWGGSAAHVGSGGQTGVDGSKSSLHVPPGRYVRAVGAPSVC